MALRNHCPDPTTDNCLPSTMKSNLGPGCFRIGAVLKQVCLQSVECCFRSFSTMDFLWATLQEGGDRYSYQTVVPNEML